VVPLLRFAHISDLHLSSLSGVGGGRLKGKRLLGYLSWRRKRRFEHHPQVLTALSRRLLSLDFDQTLITGDLLHVGLPEEFIQARDWLEKLGPADKLALVPGNHDAYAPEAWAESFAQWQAYLQGDEPPSRPQALYPSLRRRGRAAFIGLSTALPTAPFMATGRLGAEQLRGLAQRLEDCRQRGLFRVIYLHHPPLSGGEKWRKRLVDSAAFEAVVAREGAELVLHGHSHKNLDRELIGPQGPIPLVGLASSSARGDHDPAAAFGDYRLRGSEGEGPWALSRTLWCWDEDTREFQPGGERRWQLQRHL